MDHKSLFNASFIDMVFKFRGHERREIGIAYVVANR